VIETSPDEMYRDSPFDVDPNTPQLGIPTPHPQSHRRFYEVLGVQTFSFGGLPGQEVETGGGIKE
jgi:hypothetical protein